MTKPWGPCPACNTELEQFEWDGRNFLTGTSRDHIRTHSAEELAGPIAADAVRPRAEL